MVLHELTGFFRKNNKGELVSYVDDSSISYYDETTKDVYDVSGTSFGVEENVDIYDEDGEEAFFEDEINATIEWDGSNHHFYLIDTEL